MPFYPGLKKFDRGPFAAQKLIDLRKFLQNTVPVRPACAELLLATWNIRDFGGHRLNPQPRLPESLYYIAEIISHFDLIALQEVNRNMSEFYKVMDILGPDYDFIATDTAETDGGNEERMAFVYDRRKVRFRGVAGEIVLKEKEEILAKAQFARTPFVVSFQTGWLKIDLCTAHLFYGADSGDKLKQRVAEIAALGKFFVDRSKKEQTNTIVLGDFNVVTVGHETMNALEGSGFKIADGIKEIATNQDETKHYDQIAYYSPDNLVHFAPAPTSGKVKFYDVVFNDEKDYQDIAKMKSEDKPVDFHQWRTWQMSDHFLLWTRLQTDFADEYLSGIAKQSTPEVSTVATANPRTPGG